MRLVIHILWAKIGVVWYTYCMSSGVEFDEDQLKYAPRANTTPGGSFGAPGQFVTPNNEPRMVQWLMKKGIVKSPTAAQVILIGLVVINLIITFVVINYFL